jgi:hypothetical protein
MFETRQHKGYYYVNFYRAISLQIACMFSRTVFIACPPQKQLIHSVSWNNRKLKGLSHKINLTFNVINIDSVIVIVFCFFSSNTVSVQYMFKTQEIELVRTFAPIPAYIGTSKVI